MKTYLSKHPIITGTLILSLTSITSRVIGFFYRIYLSRIFGAENLGVLQLTSPICAMVFALTGAGMQTAISKYVSSVPEKESEKQRAYLYNGLSFVFIIAGICSYLVYTYADILAVYFLSEARTAPLLKVMAFSFPLSAAHACLNGYYLGKGKTAIPAASQLIEQCARVGIVYICCSSFMATGDTPSLSFTAWGAFLGEAAALFITVAALLWNNSKPTNTGTILSHLKHKNRHFIKELLKMSLPLNLNRLSVNFLQSIESIRLPLMLQLYGMTDSAALSTYGILTGMALPVLFFPGAFTGALSATLLPIISQANSKKDKEKIKMLTINISFFVIFAGLFLGILFFMFSDFLANVIFKEPLAGVYIRALCLLCPFMYVNTIFSSILQGLGDTMSILFINLTGLLLRLGFVFFLVPKTGIKAYLTGLLLSQIYSSFMYIKACLKQTKSQTAL